MDTCRCETSNSGGIILSEKKQWRKRITITRLDSLGFRFILLFVATLVLGLVAPAQEVFDATAFGTSTQMGRNVAVKLIIDRYSTPEDRKTIEQAFATGQNQGLVDALSK